MLSSVPKFLILVIYALAKATSGICPAVPVTWILNRYGILKAALCKFALGVRSPGHLSWGIHPLTRQLNVVISPIHHVATYIIQRQPLGLWPSDLNGEQSHKKRVTVHLHRYVHPPELPCVRALRAALYCKTDTHLSPFQVLVGGAH